MNLTDLCEVFTDGDWIESKDQSKDGIRLIQTGNIGIGQFIEKDDKAKYISIETFERLKCTEVFEGDILVSRLPDPIGRACIVPNKTERLITAVDCTICRPKADIIDREYLCYFMQSKTYYERLFNNVTGTTRKRISRKNLGNVEIYVPSKEEQKIIVKKLNLLTKIISNRTKELSYLDNLIKARFVELFGYLMENPFNWPMKTIADVSLFLKSGLSRKLSDEDIGLPVIRSGNIQNGQFIFDNVKYWYKDDPQGANTKDYVLEDGDVLVNFINSSSQIGKTAIYRDTGRDCIYTTNIFRMKLADNCNEYYYNWFAMSDYYYRHLQNIIQPAVNQSSFTTVNFLKLPIPLPAKDKQNEFAEFVKQVDKSKVVVPSKIKNAIFAIMLSVSFGQITSI